jgi:hypothetical protein
MSFNNQISLITWFPVVFALFELMVDAFFMRE